MAIRKVKPKLKVVEEAVTEVEQQNTSTPELTELGKKKLSMGVSTGMLLLLVGGLAHMLPTQLAPLLAWSFSGVTVQMVVGVVSVVVALYYLLGE